MPTRQLYARELSVLIAASYLDEVATFCLHHNHVFNLTRRIGIAFPESFSTLIDHSFGKLIVIKTTTQNFIEISSTLVQKYALMIQIWLIPFSLFLLFGDSRYLFWTSLSILNATELQKQNKKLIIYKIRWSGSI